MASFVKKLVLAIVLTWGALAYADPPPPRPQRQHEILRERPSGFWTSNRPAVNGAYRWRLLGIGVAIAGVMGIVMLRVMRSARESRASRSGTDRRS